MAKKTLYLIPEHIGVTFLYVDVAEADTSDEMNCDELCLNTRN